MNLKIISEKTLSQYLYSDNILLIDLRNQESYEKAHIPGAVRMDWEHAEDEMPELLNKFVGEHGHDPEWIIVYCDAGSISLLVARDLAVRGYPVMSLNGGFRRWHSDIESAEIMTV